MSIGSEENPYILILPYWMSELIEEREGVTAQEYANEFFLPHVKVEVVS